MVNLKHPVFPPPPLSLGLFMCVWAYAHLASAFTAGLSLASIPHFIITTITKRESCVLQCLYEGQRTTLWVLGLTLVTWLAGQLPLPTVPYCLPSVPHFYPISRQRKIIKDSKLMIFFLVALPPSTHPLSLTNMEFTVLILLLQPARAKITGRNHDAQLKILRVCIVFVCLF